jgi:hypothetical protein
VLDIYWNILTMHGPINGKFRNNTSKWQMGFNSAFKGLILVLLIIAAIQGIYSNIPKINRVSRVQACNVAALLS